MKIRRITPADAPIVLRMAISRLFSMTSSTSDATMLSAATITMRPIVSEIATFSSHSAEYNGWFNCVQSCTRNRGTELLLQRLTHGNRVVHVGQPQLHHVRAFAVQQVGRRVHRHERVRAVDLVEVQAEDPDDLERAVSGLQAAKRRFELRCHRRHGVTHGDAERPRQRVTEHDAFLLLRRALAESDERSADHGRADVGDARLACRDRCP